jgi:hypothetical protein
MPRHRPALVSKAVAFGFSKKPVAALHLQAADVVVVNTASAPRYWEESAARILYQ